jgi:hypothetical protein
MIREFFWRIVASIVTRPRVTTWLIAHAQRTPYYPITKRSGTEVYMDRWWVFNPYGKDANGDPTPARWPLLPSIRIHHIKLPDDDAHFHDHPWNARTIILRGGYIEERPGDDPVRPRHYPVIGPDGATGHAILRGEGDTDRLLFDQFHRIRAIPSDGAWTLFITWRKRGTWGFLVDGNKVPWREYLGEDA